MVAVPETLFKYEPFSLRAIQNLKQRTIYFGSPSGFNDPFDCALKPRFSSLSDVQANAVVAKLLADPSTPPAARNQLQNLPMDELKQQLSSSAEKLIETQCDDFNKTKGISCFSEVNDNLLMWSHYGGQHRGFCLEFESNVEPLVKLHQVTYKSEIPEIDVSRILVDEDYHHVLDLFCTKSSDWAYEREWRVIHGSVGTPYTYDASALKAIYFGAKMSRQDIDMLCLILDGQDTNATLYRGHRSDREFRIEFEQFEYTSLKDARRTGVA